MKVKIFNRGKGWYVPCSNYKDESDKAYLNIYFPNHTEPAYIDNGRGFSSQDIIVQEAKFTSYQGKVGLTVFKYDPAIPRVEGQPYDERYTATIKVDRGSQGAEISGIDTDDLPFM